jgi:DNA-binding transcriptional regulator YhcF (GntR family)
VSKVIYIDNNLGIPKYKQIVNSIYLAIENGLLQRGDKIDSINTICKEFSLSRDTVLIAFKELKAKGILISTPGKGYYIKSINVKNQEKVFLLFDELNAFKEDLYNAFLQSLNPNIMVDIYFHHFNRNVFNSVLKENLGNYSKYVIMPATFQNFYPLLDEIIDKKLYILDQTKPEFKNRYSSVYQNFEEDVYNALVSGESLLKKYKKLIMVFPGGKEPKGQLNGFEKYCKNHNWEKEIIADPFNRDIQKGEVYIVPNDRHLVYLVKLINEKGLVLGKDIGMISYNDTPLKEIVSGGITTISTDFKKMGEILAKLIENKKIAQIENPSSLIIRKSL